MPREPMWVPTQVRIQVREQGFREVAGWRYRDQRHLALSPSTAPRGSKGKWVVTHVRSGLRFGLTGMPYHYSLAAAKRVLLALDGVMPWHYATTTLRRLLTDEKKAQIIRVVHGAVEAGRRDGWRVP